MQQHTYTTHIQWTGNKGTGTSRYDEYERSHTLSVEHKPELQCSSDTIFRGDGSKHNPEDMLLASLSSCHMLWYLHLCADASIVVTDYKDKATATLVLPEGGNGYFSEAVLHPEVTVLDESMIEQAMAMHNKAHEKCFIANSCNFPVTHRPECKAQ